MPSRPWRFRAIALMFWLPFFSVYCAVVCFSVVAPKKNLEASTRMLRFWAKHLMKCAGARIHTRGFELFDPEKQFIIVSNHLSTIDIPLLMAIIPIHFRMAAKAELFRIPLFGRGMTSMGFVPVERHNREAAKQVVGVALKKLQDKRMSLWMAPEGTRVEGDSVSEFKMGAFVLASRLQIEILPVCIYGTQYVLEKNSLLLNWRKGPQDVYVTALKPSADPGDRKVWKNNIRNQIAEEFDRLKKAY